MRQELNLHAWEPSEGVLNYRDLTKAGLPPGRSGLENQTLVVHVIDLRLIMTRENCAYDWSASAGAPDHGLDGFVGRVIFKERHDVNIITDIPKIKWLYYVGGKQIRCERHGFARFVEWMSNVMYPANPAG